MPVEAPYLQGDASDLPADPADLPTAPADLPAAPADQPDPYAQPARSRRRLVVACLIGISGPLVGWLAWHGDQVAAFILHALAAVVAWAYWRRPDAPEDLMALQAATLAAAFPVVGTPIALIIFGRVTAPRDDLHAAYKAYIAFEHNSPRWSRPMQDAQAELLREVSVRPLADQLRHGDLASKQAAAEALRRMEGDEGVRVLRQALRHPAEDTRLLASLALVKLEEQLADRLGRARQAAADRPDDAAAQRGLIAAVQRYAASGLPAGKAAEPLWREAEGAALRARACDPGQAGDDIAIARARQALGDPEAALAAAERAVGVAPDQPDPGLLLCELLYALGRTTELRRAAAALRQVALPGSDAFEIAAFWSPAGDAA